MTRREQGDLGELSAMEWFAGRGAKICVPLGHSPDWDFVVELDGELLRVQVKTSTFRRKGRWEVAICTRGGNQSWSGLVKRFGAAGCDYLFVVAGDGRRWCIPSDLVEGGNAIRLGGPKYERFEVERGRPLVSTQPAPETQALASNGPVLPRLAAARGDVRVVKGDGL